MKDMQAVRNLPRHDQLGSGVQQVRPSVICFTLFSSDLSLSNTFASTDHFRVRPDQVIPAIKSPSQHS